MTKLVYELKRSIVETVHKEESFRVEADSLDEAKRKVNNFEVDPISEKVLHYNVAEVEDAVEED